MKPDNCLITAKGVVKTADFGSSKKLEGISDETGAMSI